MIEEAKAYFHGAEKYNCAQAVLAALGSSPELIQQAAAYGSGNAPDGMCGAFYAVKMLLGDAAFDEIGEEIEFCTGGLDCIKIRTPDLERCREFVGLAADVAQQQLAC